jgi:hypothetical protein
VKSQIWIKYKVIMNDWNYDNSCTLTSLPVWDLVFVVQSVPNKGSKKETEKIAL